MARIVVDEMPRFEDDCPFAQPWGIEHETGKELFACRFANHIKEYRDAKCHPERCEWLVPFMTDNDIKDINVLLGKFTRRK